jgi:predicted PurR-regulated permease PerM
MTTTVADLPHRRDRWPPPLRRRAVVAAAIALLLVLWLGLFDGLFGALAGYVLYALVQRSASRDKPLRHRIAYALLVAALLGGGAIALVEGFHLLINATTDGLPRLMQLLADTLDHVRGTAPDWIALRIVVHLLLGLVIGVAAHVSIDRRPGTKTLPALAIERWRQLALAFADVLAAQLRIAVVNAILTAIYLLAVLPAVGAHVPLGVTLVAFTFFASLLPIVGNLMSNTAIIIASLTVSLGTGVASFIFLIAVHKLEYFLNAHFVGSRVDMPIYALLASMLVLESAFGATGLIAAPVYCAWLTRELRVNGWIGA